MPQTISAKAILNLLPTNAYGLLDVRSEGEFASASIPGFVNAPILDDQERHEVGLCYRQQGQAAAIELGERLVGPTQTARVSRWLKDIKPGFPLIVCCWRGGMRSGIASEWLEQRGHEVLRVDGGYKAMRRELLEVLANPPEFKLISGLTGAGKTRLLHDLPLAEKLDIEDLAAHRGSSFGKFLHRSQPTQTNFENRLAFALRGCRRPVLVEDESKVIGSLHLPETLMDRLSKSPVIMLEASLDERCLNIYQEYIAQVLDNGFDNKKLEELTLASTLKLQRRLGGLLTSQLVSQIQDAFATRDQQAHMRWIAMLLTEYYDSRYRHSQLHGSRPLAFRGNYAECRQWILVEYARGSF